MTMRIGIDISQIVYGTGVSFYTKELVRNLLRYDKENEYILFGGSLRRIPDLKRFASSLAGRFSTKFVPVPPSIADLMWNQIHFPKIEKLTGMIDVYHSSDWTQAPSDAFKVTTIHDLAPFKYPQFTNKKIIEVHKRRLNWINREADRIIVPSYATKNDLVKLGMEEDKIRVIYEASGEAFKPAIKSEIEQVKRKYKIPGDYIFVVGVGGRKNTDKTISAFELARAGKNLTLVLAGKGSEVYTNERNIRGIGQVDDKELAILYSGASCLIYASLYEGFGLVILQAFACGCPVVTSDKSSMKEIAGDAAILVDPDSVSSIVEGIRKALAGPQGLIKKGFERAKEFTWEKAARETMNVYKEATK